MQQRLMEDIGPLKLDVRPADGGGLAAASTHVVSQRFLITDSSNSNAQEGEILSCSPNLSQELKRKRGSKPAQVRRKREKGEAFWHWMGNQNFDSTVRGGNVDGIARAKFDYSKPREERQRILTAKWMESRGDEPKWRQQKRDVNLDDLGVVLPEVQTAAQINYFSAQEKDVNIMRKMCKKLNRPLHIWEMPNEPTHYRTSHNCDFVYHAPVAPAVPKPPPKDAPRTNLRKLKPMKAVISYCRSTTTSRRRRSG